MQPSPGRWLTGIPIGAVWVVIALAGWWFFSPPPPAATPAAAHVDAPPESHSAFAPLPDVATLGLDERKVALGRRLYHDPRLSSDGRLSCATCHDLARGGTDNERFSAGKNGQLDPVNTPTVYNSGFNFSQFWDGRSPDLEAQADGPVTNPLEFATTWPDILARLSADQDLLAGFKAAYPDGLTAANARNAIAEFERSLVTPSRFDRFLKGDDQALSAAEKRGFMLFQSYGCSACHQGVNIGGNLYQKLGIVKDYFRDRPDRQADRGRFNVTHDPKDMHVFKVPGLRNVALTAPYLHDASAATLDEAVTIMARYQLGVEMPAADKADMVAFLKSLTGDGL